MARLKATKPRQSVAPRKFPKGVLPFFSGGFFFVASTLKCWRRRRTRRRRRVGPPVQVAKRNLIATEPVHWLRKARKGGSCVATAGTLGYPLARPGLNLVGTAGKYPEREREQEVSTSPGPRGQYKQDTILFQ
eukprot:gene8514-4873_t